MIRVIDQIAGFVQRIDYTDLPAEVSETAVDAMTDAVGVGFAGSREPIAAAIRTALDIESGPDGPALIGFTGRCSAGTAALYNGAVIHALDFDDTNHPAYAHPSSHLLPIVLDAVRRGGVDGKRAITAYVAGLEIEARLGATLNMGHYLHGWHTTGTFGAIAATTAAAYLYGLDLAQTRTALAMAASMAGGLRANFGTMTKPLHAGLSARTGVQSARLSLAGFTASDDALDGRFGYLSTFSTPEQGPELEGRLECWTTLGRQWETVSPYGLAIKPYPSCGATHPAIEAALLAREEIGEVGIEAIDVATTENSGRILIYPRPTTGLQGKFSMQFCVAAALDQGRVDLATFSDESVERPSTIALVEKVEVGVQPELRHNTEFAAEVTVRTADGRTVRRRVELAKGKRERWLTPSELGAKFRSCAAPALGVSGADRAFATLQHLGDVGDLADLAGLFHA